MTNSCTPARLEALRLVAAEAEVPRRLNRSLAWLDENDLIDIRKHFTLITAKGDTFLKHHCVRGTKIVECDKRKRITKTTVKKDYGLTDALVAELLPPPMLLENPHWKQGPPMQLWFDDEVAAILRKPDVMQRLEEVRQKRAKRVAAAAKGVAKKRAKTAELVDEAIKHIHVKIISLKKLRRRAIDSRIEWYEATEQWERTLDANGAPEEVVNRWMVNYVRHHLTNYEEGLFDMANKVGCHEEYGRYKTAVMNEIAKAYPALAPAVRASLEYNAW